MLEFRQAETLLWQSCLYHASSSHLSQCICKGTKWPTSFAQCTLNWLRRMPLRACTGSHSHVTKFLRYSFQRTLEAWPCLTLWGRKTAALANRQPSFSRSPTVSLFSLKWKCTFLSFCSACLYVGVVGYCGARNLVKVESRNTDPRASSQFDHGALIRARNHPPNFHVRTLHWLISC